MLKKAALATGVVFLLIGILGFVPALTPGDKLLGIFMVGGIHNAIHMLSGIAAVAASRRSDWSRLFFKVMGVVYALVTVLGFIAGDGGSILGLFIVNTNDNFLHLVAQELAEVGADVEVVPLELGTLIGRLGAGDFELATLQLPELTEPNVLRVFLHSTSIPPEGANRGRVRDAEVDRLLDLGATTPDPAARKLIYAQLEQRIRDQALLIPLWHEDQIAVVSDRARGFLPSAEGRWLGLADLR